MPFAMTVKMRRGSAEWPGSQGTNKNHRKSVWPPPYLIPFRSAAGLRDIIDGGTFGGATQFLCQSLPQPFQFHLFRMIIGKTNIDRPGNCPVGSNVCRGRQGGRMPRMAIRDNPPPLTSRHRKGSKRSVRLQRPRITQIASAKNGVIRGRAMSDST